MKLRIAIFPADFAIRPDELARAVEERGFESLFFTDHTHIPATPQTRKLMQQPRVECCRTSPTTTTLRRPDVRRRRHADAAARNRRVPRAPTRADRDGQGTRQPRRPLARTRAVRRRRRLDPRGDRQPRHRPTDALGGHGRAGAGDARDLDPGGSGVPWPPCGVRTHLVLAQAEEQRPHPPILVGGAGKGVIRRVLAYGDEWIPHAGMPVEQLGARIRELQHAARKAGRRADIPVTVQGAEPDAHALNELREVGVTRATLYAPSADADQVLRFLDDVAPFVDATNATQPRTGQLRTPLVATVACALRRRTNGVPSGGV